MKRLKGSQLPASFDHSRRGTAAALQHCVCCDDVNTACVLHKEREGGRQRCWQGSPRYAFVPAGRGNPPQSWRTLRLGGAPRRVRCPPTRTPALLQGATHVCGSRCSWAEHPGGPLLARQRPDYVLLRYGTRRRRQHQRPLVCGMVNALGSLRRSLPALLQVQVRCRPAKRAAGAQEVGSRSVASTEGSAGLLEAWQPTLPTCAYARRRWRTPGSTCTSKRSIMRAPE